MHQRLVLYHFNAVMLQQWPNNNSKLPHCIFFNCYLAVPRPTLSHSQGDSLTNSMLMTAFVHVRPEDHRETCNEIGSLSLAECLAGFQPGTFQFWLQRLNRLVLLRGSKCDSVSIYLAQKNGNVNQKLYDALNHIAGKKILHIFHLLLLIELMSPLTSEITFEIVHFYKQSQSLSVSVLWCYLKDNFVTVTV